MNKLAKGSIAGAAGIILLLGGAGTLASWNASSNLNGNAAQSISAGQLKISTSGSGVWKSGANTIDPSTFKVVPGDTLTFTQTFSVNAIGDNLLFTAGLTPGAITPATTSGANSAADAALKNALTQNATFAIAGGNVAASTTAGTYKLTSNSGTSTVTATVTITFPFGTAGDNSTQSGNVSLAAGAINLIQTQTP